MKALFWQVILLVGIWCAFVIFSLHYPSIPWLDRDYGTYWTYQ